MALLERRLARAGYRTANWDYPSRTHEIGAITDRLAPKLAAVADGEGGAVHLVTHSMGGLVARALLTRERPLRLGRVVMLAPPNGGSDVADRLHRLWPYRWRFGPAGLQLVTQRDAATAALFGPVDYALGVIAGPRSLYPFGSRWLPGPNDGLVAVARTVVAGMADHLLLPVSHPMMLRHRGAAEQVIAFLRDGRFMQPDRAARPPQHRAAVAPAS